MLELALHNHDNNNYNSDDCNPFAPSYKTVIADNRSKSEDLHNLPLLIYIFISVEIYRRGERLNYCYIHYFTVRKMDRTTGRGWRGRVFSMNFQNSRDGYLRGWFDTFPICNNVVQ